MVYFYHRLNKSIMGLLIHGQFLFIYCRFVKPHTEVITSLSNFMMLELQRLLFVH